MKENYEIKLVLGHKGRWCGGGVCVACEDETSEQTKCAWWWWWWGGGIGMCVERGNVQVTQLR